ncbi:hypothetical protein IZ6_24070 [Terrihabitans soli]|uniref:DUF374 domain-containing protein n=1 Tax=Terrihabitans soli TaxID=708113 RepID=A0A6S6QWQ7_9HYPH|nr:lysophospholipid acyltransferase family protein [Terrihabitans soli]BCJ91672.1 hypothetical protein IZ6_24070 [Terrihabitans soli]
MNYKKIVRSPFVLNLAGSLIAFYIRIIGKTTRFVQEPADLRGALAGDLPLIMALWHGQHVITPLAWPKDWPGSALVARHADGEINAIALEKLGFNLVRGSGAHHSSDRAVTKRGGVLALRGLVRALNGGSSVTLTADVPKIGGVVGTGIVLLAKLSGRPIYPLAVVTKNCIALNTWDQAHLALPFSRGAMVVGEKITVAEDASDEDLEIARLKVERGLDLAHARAYELVGGKPWRVRNG